MDAHPLHTRATLIQGHERGRDGFVQQVCQGESGAMAGFCLRQSRSVAGGGSKVQHPLASLCSYGCRMSRCPYGVLCPLFPPRGEGGFPDVVEPVALAVGLQDVNAACKPVQEGTGEPFVSLRLWPRIFESAS